MATHSKALLKYGSLASKELAIPSPKISEISTMLERMTTNRQENRQADKQPTFSITGYFHDALAFKVENRCSAVAKFEGTSSKSNPPVFESLKDFDGSRAFQLRTKEDTMSKQSTEVELKQFNPNFFSPNDIRCRFPGCQQRRPPTKGKADPKAGNKVKDDLYLCPEHGNNVKWNVRKLCEEKGVHIDKDPESSSEDFHGYTSLIRYLENGYDLPVKGNESFEKFFEEISLNVRNYLLIVNALLNPDKDNQQTALQAVLAVLREILLYLDKSDTSNLDVVRGLVELLKEIIEYILIRFGVVYSWVHLHLAGNPVAQVGAAVGGALGMIGFARGPGTGVLTTAAGSVFGSLFANGAYNWWKPKQELLQKYQKFTHGEPSSGVYYTTSDTDGRLCIWFILDFKV